MRSLPDPQPTALVANLPYNVSVPVLLHLLAAFPTIRHGLVLVQLEVADRLVAAPGSKVYGVPSAKLAWYGPAARVGLVPRVGVLAGARMSNPGWSGSPGATPPADQREPGRGVRGDRRGLRPAPQDAALGAGRLGGLRRGGRGDCWSGPGWIPPRAARPST